MLVDEHFMRLAVEEATKSTPEPGRPSPRVGAVAVRDGSLLAKAYRGETGPGEHAEFVLLERKLAGSDLGGATVYTTLEPCTARNAPKIPCAERLIAAGVVRVVAGMLDPNPVISGKGYHRLRQHGIEFSLFTAEHMMAVERLNREFSEQFPPEAARLMRRPHGRMLRSTRLWLGDDQFLGMGWRKRGGATEALWVSTFQCVVTNMSLDPMRRLRGALTCGCSNLVVPIGLNRDGVLVPADGLRSLKASKVARVGAPFPTAGGAPLSDLQFLDRCTPFSVELETDLGSDQLTYTREDCEAEIARMQAPSEEDGVEWAVALGPRP